MAFAHFHPSFSADEAAARESLGSESPIARVSAQLSRAVDQLIVAAVLLTGAALWFTVGARYAPELVIGSGVAVIALVGRIAVLRLTRDEMMLELLSRVEERVPLVAFDRLRRRLVNPDARRRLARTIAAIRARASRPSLPCAVPVDPRVIRAAGDELEMLIDLLEADDAGTRGVARAYRLVTGPGSPLYGTDVQMLREELHQIRFLLESDPPAKRSPE